MENKKNVGLILGFVLLTAFALAGWLRKPGNVNAMQPLTSGQAGIATQTPATFDQTAPAPAEPVAAPATAPQPAPAPAAAPEPERQTATADRPTYRVTRQETAAKPVRKKRSIQKSAAIIGGSAGVGAAIGALGGGGKGAAIGAISGGAAGLIYDQLTRNR
ncbi:MAG: hypothetical protein IRZ15_14500 [Bryobacteraceae bacterium]|nr:hypothetical protein [Bryobacteraceae bacterium]